MLAWFCAQSRLDSRLEFGFQLEASQSPGMGGWGPKKRLSATGAIAQGGNRVDARGKSCTCRAAIRGSEALASACSCLWCRCCEHSRSVLGGVSRAELLCCCATTCRASVLGRCCVTRGGEAARHFVWLCVSGQYSDSSEYLSYALIRKSCAVL